MYIPTTSSSSRFLPCSLQYFRGCNSIHQYLNLRYDCVHGIMMNIWTAITHDSDLAALFLSLWIIFEIQIDFHSLRCCKVKYYLGRPVSVTGVSFTINGVTTRNRTVSMLISNTRHKIIILCCTHRWKCCGTAPQTYGFKQAMSERIEFN